MAATFQASAAAQSTGSGTTSTLTVPAGVRGNDVGLLWVVAGSTGTQTPTLTGPASMQQATQVAVATVGQDRFALLVVTGVQAGDVLTCTWSATVSTGRGMFGAWYRNAAFALDTGSSTALSGTAAFSPATVTAATTNAANETVVYLGLVTYSSVTNATFGSGTQRASDTTMSGLTRAVQVVVNDAVQVATGSTGTATLSWSSGAAIDGMGVIVVLKSQFYGNPSQPNTAPPPPVMAAATH